MHCDMDSLGNCIIDSATCAQWMAEGKLDSTDCVGCEPGKCHIKSDACMKAGGCKMGMKDCGDMKGGCKMGEAKGSCDAACMQKCKEMGMDCKQGSCPHAAGMSAGHDCSKGCSAECMKACKEHGMECKGEAKGCCKK
jgi:hypothetical protein